jgi:hypothetical protein
MRFSFGVMLSLRSISTAAGGNYKLQATNFKQILKINYQKENRKIAVFWF